MKRKYSISIITIISIIVVSCTKKQTTKGHVIGSTMNPIIGYDWEAKSWYKFEVDGKIYVDTIYFNANEKVLIEGDVIRIEYNAENPMKHEIKN